MERSTIKFITISILLLAIILLPNIVSAETQNSIIVKQSNNYIIYNESIMKEEFTFAFGNSKEEKDLIYFPSAKAENGEEGRNVAYIDEETKAYINETGDTFFFVKNKVGEYILEGQKIDIKQALDKKYVEETTKRIKVDTTKNNIEVKEINGVKTEITKGKVVITDDAKAKYSYILIKLPTTGENDYTKLMKLAEKISNKEEVEKLELIEKLKLMESFYTLYKEKEPKSNDSSWLPVENLEIMQPEDSKNEEQYIVYIKSENGEETTIDAQFLTSYEKYTPIYEKETIKIKETTKLPVTFDSTITLIVIFAIIVVAIIVLLVIRKKVSKKEEKK